jgi:uncharacterized protein (TIGR02453 family)
MLKKSTLDFLKKLKKNNNRVWFNANKNLYEDAKMDFEVFVFELIQETSEFDNSISDIQPKDCIFRIYKDVRFSKDKTPYKTNMGAAIQEGGRKSGLAGYYFHIQPGEFFLAGGLYLPEADKLLKIRNAISAKRKEFLAIVKNKEFVKNFKEVWGDKLKTAPKGFAKDHPMAEYLKLKSFLAYCKLNKPDLFSKNIIKKTAKIFKSMRPLNDFLNRAV